MSLGDILFASGFDSQDPGVLDVSNNATTFLTSNNRTPTSIAHYRGNPQGGAALRDSTGAQVQVSEAVFGVGFRAGSLPDMDILQFKSPNGQSNMRLTILSGKFCWRRADDTVMAVGGTTVPASTWCWLWGYVKINDTTGIVRLKLNGVTEIATTTGLDTRTDTGTNGDKINQLWLASDTNAEIDDLYLQDATGTVSNGDDIDIGELTIPYLVPNAAGDTTGMTPSAGSNFQCVDEVPPNDDTDYVAAATSGVLDLYNIVDAPATAASVKGVVIRDRMKKDAAGAKNARILLKSGGTVSNGSDLALGTTYQTFTRNLRKNPVTAADFTTAEITALQIGQEART